MTARADGEVSVDGSQIAEVRRRTFTVRTPAGEGEIAGVEFGDPARPFDVIFLHANGFNALTYRTVLAPLGASLHILAIDQQGHGRSPQRERIDGRVNWLGFRDDLVALLDLIVDQPVILSGHSMGGTASILATAERPDRVKALALFDPVILPEEMVRRAIDLGDVPFADSALAVGARRRRAVFAGREEVFQSYHGRGPFKAWSDQALRDYIADGFADRADGQVELTCAPDWESSNFANQAHDSWSALRKVRCPVRILRAGQGSTCSIADAGPFLADNPAMTVETIEGTSHFLPIERPDLVAETLLELGRA
jgi:pimeloyl-ACP methyl ester carboxylesterase